VACPVRSIGEAGLARTLAPLPEAARPFDESTPRGGMLKRARIPVVTEYRIGFDNRSVDIVRYLPADPTFDIDSTVLWQTHYSELSDYLDDLAMSGQETGWLREIDSMRGFRDSVIDAGNRYELPVKIPDWAKRLGMAKPALTLTGSYALSLRAESRWTSLEEEAGTANRVPDIIPQQIPNIFLTGTIGRLITVTLNWTEEGFGANQNQMLQVRYAGEKPEDTEDDILQEAAFGQIALNLPGSTLTGYNYAATGLIGLMARMRFGDVDLTVVGGAEKGERQKQKIGRGATESKTTFLDNDIASPPRDLFLTYNYRKTWIDRQLDAKGVQAPSGLRVFQRVKGSEISAKPEWKPWYKGQAEVLDTTGRKTGTTTTANETWRQLAEGSDWWWDKGILRVNSRGTATDEAIAAVWTDSKGKFGSVSGSNAQMILLRDPNSEHVELRYTHLRNRYYKLPSVVAADRPQVTVTIRLRSGGQSDATVDSTGTPWAKVFGLVDSTGKLRVDNEAIFDWAHGALIFPDIEPFRKYERAILYDSSLSMVTGSSYTPRFQIEVVARGKSDKIEIGSSSSSNVSGSNCMDISQGSEVLTLNGSTVLEKGVDYDVTYSTGTIYLLSARAKDPSADITVDYECTPFFSLETRTVAGARVDWQIPWIGTESKLGATLLYRSETVTDPRPQLDREPNLAWLWGANMTLAGEAEWMTELADRIPLVKPTGDSKWKFEFEGAQSYHNPNTEGYALVDDFESARQETGFPIGRTSWYHASPPKGPILPASAEFPLGLNWWSDSWQRQGEFVWSSNAQEALVNIYPNYDDGDNATSRQNLLQFRLRPNDHGYVGNSWGGVMRSLSSGTTDNSDAKFLEVVTKASGGVLIFDFGQIGEDLAINGNAPNGKLDGEDVDASGAATGVARNDYGLDGVNGLDDSSETGMSWDCFTNCSGTSITRDMSVDPGGDNYSSDVESNDPASSINGTEDNNRQVDGGTGTYFDTEDLNKNSTLDATDNFDRFAIRLGGKGRTSYQSLRNGWRLYRIPLTDTLYRSGKGADWTNLSTMRILYTGLRPSTGANTLEDRVQIARMALVGNQWVGGGHLDGNDSAVVTDSTVTGAYEDRDTIIFPDSSRLNVSVVNTRDDAGSYVSWDVPQSTDASSGAVLTEQSLKLEYRKLRSDFALAGTDGKADSGFAVRAFESAKDFTMYKDLILLVYHAGQNGEATPVRMGIQYGTGDWHSSTAPYYEYSFSPVSLDCPLGGTGGNCPDDADLRKSMMQNNWSQNKIQIALQDLSRLKNKREAAGVSKDSTFRIGLGAVPYGDAAIRKDSILVHGSPSLSEVDWIRFWVRANPANTPAKSGEIWVNDLRLESPDRALGTALRASAQTNMADLLDLSASAEYTEGDFVKMGEAHPKLSQQASTVSLATAGRLNLSKFLPESWGAQLPLNASANVGLKRPWAQPGSDMVLTKDGLGEMFSDWWGSDLRRDTVDRDLRNSKYYQTLDASQRISTSWSRQRDQSGTFGGMLTNTLFARPTVAWSWTQTGRLAPESRDTSRVQGFQFDYDFSPSKTPTWKPFSQSRSKWTPSFVSGLGVQPWPNKINATLLDVDFTEHWRTSLDADRDTILITRWDTTYSIPGDTNSIRIITPVRAITFERSASLRHSLSSEWQLLDFLRLSGTVGSDRAWNDVNEADDFNPAHLWRATPRIFSLDTTLDPGDSTKQVLGILRNENRRAFNWQMDFSPKLLPFLSTGSSFRSSASASRDANQLYVLRLDSLTRDTLSHQYWRMDQQDAFSANTSLSFSDLVRTMQNIGPDAWDKGLDGTKNVLDKWRFNSIGFEYGVDARTSGVRQTLGFAQRQQGLEGAEWWRWQAGLGDESTWRSPIDLVTGSRSKMGMGQYEPWRLDDPNSYGNGFRVASDWTSDSSHVDRSSMAATRAYHMGANTSFTIPGLQLTVNPSWRWQKSWVEQWEDPSNVDTSITDPSISLNMQLANFANRVPGLGKLFASAVANHTTTWEKTFTVHPHIITSDEESRTLRFQPLLGLSFKTHGNWTFGNDVKYSIGWGYDYEKRALQTFLVDASTGDSVLHEGLCTDDALPAYYTDPRIETPRCFEQIAKEATRLFEVGDDATATYRLPTKRGIQILKWFLRLENDLVINFGAGWGYSRKTKHSSNDVDGTSEDQTMTTNTKVYARSNASYNFTPKLVAEFLAEYQRNESWVQSNAEESKISYLILAQAQLRYNF